MNSRHPTREAIARTRSFEALTLLLTYLSLRESESEVKLGKILEIFNAEYEPLWVVQKTDSQPVSRQTTNSTNPQVEMTDPSTCPCYKLFISADYMMQQGRGANDLMRAIVITLFASRPATIPIAYNEYVQGALYRCWENEYPQLHDIGFEGHGKTFRMFTFSALKGKSKVDSKRKIITFSGAITLEVRSPIEEFMEEIAAHFGTAGEMRIASTVLPVINIQTRDRMMFPQRAVIKTLSPIVAYRTASDGKTDYYSPNEADWAELVSQNALRKIEASGATCDTAIQIIPFSDSLRKRVTRFKGFYITGWEGEFAFTGNAEDIALLYSTGLGAKSSQGFGMFDIVDRPL